MNRFLKVLEKFVKSPFVNMAIGFVLLITGLMEAWDTLQEDLVHLHFKAHHGMIIFGFFNILKSVPDIFEGLEKHFHKK